MPNFRQLESEQLDHLRKLSGTGAEFGHLVVDPHTGRESASGSTHINPPPCCANTQLNARNILSGFYALARSHFKNHSL